MRGKFIGAGQTCDQGSGVDVLTHRNNKYRTGANLGETGITWANVGSLHKSATLPVTGQVYGQPLVKTHLRVHNQVTSKLEEHDVVFIATISALGVAMVLPLALS